MSDSSASDPSPHSHLVQGDHPTLVTGSSSGIGRATAIELAVRGFGPIGIHYRSNRSGAESTADQVRQAGCPDVRLFQADLADADARRDLVEHAFNQLGPIQTWVNNAGADVLTGAAAEWDFQTKLRHLMEIDVIATIDLSRRVASAMRAASQAASKSRPSPPSITFIGWDQAGAGMEGDAGQMFGPVKAAVMAFAASFAQELAPEIRVNTIAPGWIKTAWGEETRGYWHDRAEYQSLMNRWGTADDVARAIAYVVNPANSFLTGQVININGGWNRRYDQS